MFCDLVREFAGRGNNQSCKLSIIFVYCFLRAVRCGEVCGW